MTIFRRLFTLMSTKRHWIAIGALLAFFAVGANVALMGLSAYLISKAALVSNVAEVALAITGVRVLAIGRAAFRYLERYVTHRATFEILADLRVWFFAAIEPLAPARLADRRSGDLLARIVGDVDTLEDFYVRVLIPPIVAALVTAFGGVLLGVFDPVLGLVLVAFLVLTGVILPAVSQRLSRAAAHAQIAARGELDANLVDEIGGLADLIVLDRAAAHRATVLTLGDEVDAAIDRLAGVQAATNALAAVFAGLAGLAVLAVGVELVGLGRLDGVFLALLPLVAVACFEVSGPLSQAFALQEANAAAARRLFELTDLEPRPGEVACVGAAADAPGAAAAPSVDAATAAPGAAASPRPSGHAIDIRGLRFRYGPDEPYVIDGLDLSIPSGTSLAIVGPSGSGKSTLVNLLLRFWEPAEGEIRIGGRDIRAYPPDDVRAMIGVVAQDVHLFNGTIRDNLAVADPDVTDERIVAACRLAQVHDTIDALPDGYDTRVGENGLLLSGGERQRLAIARAIIKDAPILVLDEATANLDVATERDLITALGPFIRGRTTIVISHRSSVAGMTDAKLTLAG
jgi:thiol reductant ABC exporter CydC subunit